MKKNDYRLLSMTSHGLQGPLAVVVDGQTNQRDLKSRALAALARLKGDNINLLGLDIVLDEHNEIHAEATGLLAKRYGRQVADGVTEAVRKKGRPLLVRDNQLIFTLYQPPIPSGAAVKVLGSRMLMDRTGRPLPATATLQVTTNCQADCAHCSAARHRHLGRPELTTEEMKSLIRQTEELGVVNIVFTGGEPLLRKDLFELISWVGPEEAIVMMFTNGLLLGPENTIRLKDAGLFSLNVSLDSSDPAIHNRLRRVPRCFERALEGIDNTLQAGILCGISTYATPQRLRRGDIMAMIELGRKIGVHEITIFDVVPTGRLLHEEEKSLLSESDKQELCLIEKEINQRADYPHIITQAHVNGPTGAGCYAGWFQFYATAYGDITPCDFTPLRFGNIREDSMQTIWNRLIEHAAYREHCNHCRMQEKEFRRQWIDTIPDAGPFPYPVEQLASKILVFDARSDAEAPRYAVGTQA
jgi:MoaA/NifB/PqqE/SkfB family radical SAM enzyme